MARPKSTQPTDGELKILQAMWDSGPARLSTLRAALSAEKPMAPTTLATMLKVMEGKGLAHRTKDKANNKMWAATLTQAKANSTMLQNLMDRLFEGSAKNLVSHLIDNHKMSAKDRNAIEELLKDQNKR